MTMVQDQFGSKGTSKKFLLVFDYFHSLILQLTLERRLFATPGAPGAGQRGHFRLSTWILRDTEVIATNDFFQKEGAPFSDR